MSRAAALLGFAARTAEADATDQAPAAPRISAANRGAFMTTSSERALSLIAVYRACFVHATAAVQLGVDVERGGRRIATPTLVSQPDLDTDRTDWVEYTINSLWLTGNAYWHKLRADHTAARPGEVLALTPLNPNEVTPREDRTTGKITYHYRGREIAAQDMEHLKLYRAPGLLVGLGPIQAARHEIEGALDARDYGASWFTESGMPSGLLTTEQKISAEQAADYRKQWEDGADGHGVRVLGNGASYTPLMLKPADLQFLESQQFSTTQIARLFGIPAGMMLAAVEGGSSTYKNLLDEWRGYLQFSAMKALREVESKWSSVLPRGQRVRFNLNAFLRLDTEARYRAHREGIAAGFLLRSEVRDMEGLDPIDGIDDQPLPAPTTKGTDSADA